MNIFSADNNGELLEALPQSGGMTVVSAFDPSTHQIERLYDDGRARLWPALARRLGNKADAEDVLHEAIVRFLVRYTGQSLLDPLAMLAKIAMNIVRDSARSEKFRRTLLSMQCEPVCAATPEPDPETALSSRQGTKLLRDAIDVLPVRCRETFLLHCVDGLPHAEVAVILGISRSMVEKHIMRAYARIRADLERAGWRHIDQSGPGGV